MTSASSEPVRLAIVYEPDEHGQMTATVPALPGTISAGRNRAKARENVLDALRLMLSTPPERRSGRGQFVEELEVTLDVVRRHERGHER